MIGKKMLYRLPRGGKRDVPVTLLGYTKAGRACVRWPWGLTSAVLPRTLRELLP